MVFQEDVRPLLAARSATNPNAARLLEMFTKAEESLSERPLEGVCKEPGARPSCHPSPEAVARKDRPQWLLLAILVAGDLSRRRSRFWS